MNSGLIWKPVADHNLYKLVKLEDHLDLDDYEHYNPRDNMSISNLTDLVYVNIPSIMNVLSERYNNNEIYTYNGTVLISINPFKAINDLYSIDNKSIDIKHPHIYSIAEQAWRQSIHTNQSILVSGESGSGKTENTKYILKYLCNKYSMHDKLCNKIINSNFIIELLGNAKTVRNDNSSRFGKFIKLYIQDRVIVGGSIESYLLEKSRISFVNSSERTYHIFYLVCQHNKTDLLKKYTFKNTIDYKILEQSNYTYALPEFNDINLLFNVFKLFDFSSHEIDSVFCKLKLILELFNYTGKDCLLNILQNLQYELSILDLDVDTITSILTTKTYKINNEKIIKTLDEDMIYIQVKSFCEDLYNELFNNIIYKINLSFGTQADSYISILDIFGFEIFEKNGYEQLCINYTNEMLQKIYNSYIFKNEQDEYRREGIAWDYITYKHNDEIINLFNGSNSIFTIMNEQSVLGSGNDTTIFNHFEQNLKCDIFNIDPIKKHSRIFSITHFTGEVEYTVDNYIFKNRITNKSTKIKTNLQYFTNQLSKLKTILESNECLFVRCIKPNNNNQPNNSNPRKIHTQLLYSGVLEGIKIILQGYPVKKNITSFNEEFKYFTYYNNKKMIDYIKSDVENNDKYQIGHSKIFLKRNYYDAFYKINIAGKYKLCSYIQKFIRGYLCRTKYIHSLYNIVRLQSFFRKKYAKTIVHEMRIHYNASVINRNIYKYLYRLQKYRYNASIVINARAKSFLHMIKYKKIKIIHYNINSTIIQLWYRRIYIGNKIKKRNYLYKNTLLEQKLLEVMDKYNEQILQINQMHSHKHYSDNRITELEQQIEQMNKNKPNDPTVYENKLNELTEHKMKCDIKILTLEQKLNEMNTDKLKDTIKIATLQQELNKNIEDSRIIHSSYMNDISKNNTNTFYTIPLTDENENTIVKSEVDTLSENNLIEIGNKMERLYNELDNNKQTIDILQLRYSSLLRAYEAERKKKNIWSLMQAYFDSD